ncbi:MAG: TFIIB-type zinc ribbon-containing protein [Candidatus Thorarchaeota archaeon]|jgi:transcription initiation factor TFIIB
MEMIALASKHAKTKKSGESKAGAARYVCSTCTSDEVYIDSTRGEVTCSNCGLVLSDRSIDMGPEWRAFTADEQNARQRVGGPTDWSKFDQGLTTIIGRQNVDASGRKDT